MANKTKATIQSQIKFPENNSLADSVIDFTDSVLSISGSLNTKNIASGSVGDPGVKGQLFITASEAVGGAAGYEVICISKG